MRLAFCKFRVMDRCTKSQQPCLFDEECFEPQDEPIPIASQYGAPAQSLRIILDSAQSAGLKFKRAYYNVD